MQEKLFQIFMKTMNAHFTERIDVSKDAYIDSFKDILEREILDAPRLDAETGNLAEYINLSVLMLCMIKNFEIYRLTEEEIGEAVYRTGEAYFTLSPVKKFIQNRLFFTSLNRKQIKKREMLTHSKSEGFNGFKLKLNDTNNPDEITVECLECGIYKYYKRKKMEKYVKYCCLTDYAIMERMGIAFSRKGTIANGCDKCDFNFSKSGVIVSGWPPYELEEFK